MFNPNKISSSNRTRPSRSSSKTPPTGRTKSSRTKSKTLSTSPATGTRKMYTSKWKTRAATESPPVSPPLRRPGAVGSSPSSRRLNPQQASLNMNGTTGQLINAGPVTISFVQATHTAPAAASPLSHTIRASRHSKDEFLEEKHWCHDFDRRGGAHAGRCSSNAQPRDTRRHPGSDHCGREHPHRAGSREQSSSGRPGGNKDHYQLQNRDARRQLGQALVSIPRPIRQRDSRTFASPSALLSIKERRRWRVQTAASPPIRATASLEL